MMSSSGVDVTAPRIDAATAAGIRTRLADKIRSNAPTPGSEAALRRMIEGFRNGTPNFAEMSPAFEQTVRKQLTQMQLMARYLGAIQAIEFKGVGRMGWDSYEVRRENGGALWRIAFSNGVIEGAIVSLTDGP
jgi:bla regulator protein blaR1